jgi:MFS family permease
MLAWIVGTVVAGQQADARGPLKPMAVGLSGFAAGLLLAAAAHGMGLFLVGRVLQGLGGGAMISSTYVAIARGYPDSLRARMMALISSVWILPALVGPSLSGLLAERLSWRVVFAGILPLAVVTAALVLPPLRRLSLDPPAEAQSSERALLALRLALGTALCLVAPSLGMRGRSLELLAGAVGLVLLLPALRRLLPPGTFLARRGLPMGMATRALLAYCFFGSEAFIPLAAGELRGATPAQAGLALSAGALGWTAASWLQNWLEGAGRNSTAERTLRVRVGLVVLSLSVALAAAVLCSRLPLSLVPLAWLLAGAGVGFSYTNGVLLCIAAAPLEEQGQVAGQLQLAEALATSASTGLGGLLLELLKQHGRPPAQAQAWVFALTLSAGLLGAALAGRLAPAAPARPAPPTS